ncbi:MAG: hypothetical protein R6T99_08930 [Bacteroidales bacterium]
MKWICTLMLFLTSMTAQPAVTVLEGHVNTPAPGDHVVISGYKNFISNELYVLGQGKIDEDGHFKIEFDIDVTTYTQIGICFQYSEFYFEPGAKYRLQIHPSEKHTEGLGSIHVQIIEPDTSLTSEIWKINNHYNNYMVSNISNAYTRISKSKADHLRNILFDKITANGHPYLKDYIEYKIASLELLAKRSSKKKLAGDYIWDKPVLYNNIEYMDFFHALYSRMLISHPALVSPEEVNTTIRDKKSYKALASLIQRSGLTGNAKVTELALLCNLKELYYVPSADQHKIGLFLRELTEQSPYPENREIAASLLKTLTRFSPGKPLPDLWIRDSAGSDVRLSSLPGKPVYLSIIHPERPGSVAELEMMKTIYPELKNRIRFISISIDPDISSAIKLKQDKDFNWDFYSLAHPGEIINKYGINRTPVFIMADADGTFISYPAFSPSEDLAGYLKRILKQ